MGVVRGPGNHCHDGDSINTVVGQFMIGTGIANVLGMLPGCPNPECSVNLKGEVKESRTPGGTSGGSGPDSGWIVRFGFYWRKSDSRHIQRFFCKGCKKVFSAATHHPCFGQKKRRVNAPLERLFSSGVSMRRAARLLGIHQITVARKLKFLAQQARASQERFLEMCVEKHGLIRNAQFDEMETFEHTKCKPLSIALIVDEKHRWIVGANVARMPAKGLLAEISRKKYGLREDKRPEAAKETLSKAAGCLHPKVEILSDSNPHYPSWLRTQLPSAIHKTVISRRGCVTGQGELKKIGLDPLFSLNHTAAMVRANINRMFRKTWCTTKRPESLLDQLAIYINYHNRVLVGL